MNSVPYHFVEEVIFRIDFDEKKPNEFCKLGGLFGRVGCHIAKERFYFMVTDGDEGAQNCVSLNTMRKYKPKYCNDIWLSGTEGSPFSSSTISAVGKVRPFSRSFHLEVARGVISPKTVDLFSRMHVTSIGITNFDDDLWNLTKRLVKAGTLGTVDIYTPLQEEQHVSVFLPLLVQPQFTVLCFMNYFPIIVELMRELQKDHSNETDGKWIDFVVTSDAKFEEFAELFYGFQIENLQKIYRVCL
ncbi:hypothetical protein QR680_014969 [Steinernema hermaphroditum]|uniref:Uncharacterized protein n=1 Tax=Steinernema hermaphroditum TaxID=289476 RepID=A0AA39IDA9_9BILA|nr:hypothetical protein QR680_014969 [Steinernema hermaphroditum]